MLSIGRAAPRIIVVLIIAAMLALGSLVVSLNGNTAGGMFQNSVFSNAASNAQPAPAVNGDSFDDGQSGGSTTQW